MFVILTPSRLEAIRPYVTQSTLDRNAFPLLMETQSRYLIDVPMGAILDKYIMKKIKYTSQDYDRTEHIRGKYMWVSKEQCRVVSEKGRTNRSFSDFLS